MHRFLATIEKAGTAVNSWCFLTLPGPIAKELGGARRIRGTLAGEPFEAAVVARGGGVKRVLVKREMRDALGLAPGDQIDVALEVDHRARPVDIPDELHAALTRKPDVQHIFAKLAPSHQREYTDWIAQAKRPQTKAARVDRALAMIAQKHHVK